MFTVGCLLITKLWGKLMLKLLAASFITPQRRMDVVASVDFLHKNLVEISRGVFAHCRHDISISRSVGMYILFSCVPDEKDIL